MPDGGAIALSFGPEADDFVTLDLADTDAAAAAGLAQMIDWMAVRTRYFDEFCMAAAGAGIKQVVILAAGLDSRAYRLPWPAGTTVYEIDLPQVIEFKTATMAGLGAAPVAQRRPVAADLRQDWPAALRAAGFDPQRPTAWLAEGLLRYLPPDAQDRLLDTVTALSAAGSQFAANAPTVEESRSARIQTRMAALTERGRAHGFDIDVADLTYPGQRHQPGTYLDERGWHTVSTSTAELFAAYGLAPLPPDDALFDTMTHLRATRT